jgi:crotonobetainyl-CoA:carnitine CoA-transferase CaiB-like acyl-CoA transferase
LPKAKVSNLSDLLAGVRVLDLTRVLAGPWATQTLADLGATVIKVEKPGVGDDTRAWGPPFVQDREGNPIPGLSAYFTCANRGKYSVAIDMAKPEGQELVRKLAAQCDVVMENFKVGGLRQYGLDYEALKAVNPRLVYCSLTGFGQDGPYANRAGYDVMVQGLGGLMSITGQPDDMPGGGPVKVGVAVTDLLTGLYSTIAILAALPRARETGIGQHIDIALLDVQVAALVNQAANYLVSGVAPVRMGNLHPTIVPYQIFDAADQQIVLNVGNDYQFAKFCAVLGVEEWSKDPRFATNPARVANRTELCAAIAERLRTRPAQVWLEGLEKAGVPAAPINSIDQVFADPQVKWRGARLDFETEDGNIPGVASPIRYSRTPVSYDRPPPKLGEHTGTILKDMLGLSDEDCLRLCDAHVTN